MSWLSDHAKEKRSELVAIRFTKSERDCLDREAEKHGVDVTRLVHHALYELYRENKVHFPLAASADVGIGLEVRFPSDLANRGYGRRGERV